MIQHYEPTWEEMEYQDGPDTEEIIMAPEPSALVVKSLAKYRASGCRIHETGVWSNPTTGEMVFDFRAESSRAGIDPHLLSAIKYLDGTWRIDCTCEGSRNPWCRHSLFLAEWYRIPLERVRR